MVDFPDPGAAQIRIAFEAYGRVGRASMVDGSLSSGKGQVVCWGRKRGLLTVGG